MSSQESRVMRILDLLNDRKSPEEIVRIMSDINNIGRKMNERGKKNEKQVAAVLSSLEGVVGVTISRNNSREDRKGKDLIVQLKPIPGHEVTYVQVKSSQLGIRSYRYRVGRNANIPASEVDNWLIEHNQILINSRSPVEVIKASFLSQLAAIRDFRRK